VKHIHTAITLIVLVLITFVGSAGAQMPTHQKLVTPMTAESAEKLSHKKKVANEKTDYATLNAGVGSRIGCLVKDIYIQAVEKTVRNPGQKPVHTQTLYISVYKYDECTGTTLSWASGESTPTTFVWTGDNPNVNGRVEVLDKISGVKQLYFVDLTFGFIFDLEGWDIKGWRDSEYYTNNWTSKGSYQNAFFWGTIGWGPETFLRSNQLLVGTQKALNQNVSGDQYWDYSSVSFWTETFNQKIRVEKK
jgi:hypothetical protein